MKLQYETGQKPLWSQLYDILEERILSNQYKNGEILPSEAALMTEFEVSRITVRQAMDKLMNAGLIIRKRGKGTIVTKNEDGVATSFKSSFHGVEEKNNANDRRVISVEFVYPDVDVAYYFGINKEDKVLRLTRQTFVDGKVMVHYESYLNPIVDLDESTDFGGSMYQVLNDVGYRISRVKERITASIMNEKEKKLFDIDGNEAVMNRIRMGYSNQTPIEYTYSKYVANGYELALDLS